MLRIAMSVPEIKVPEINRERHGGAKHAHRIALVNRKITKHQKAPERAAFPKSKRNHAFPSPLGRYPLDQESKTEHDAAGQAHYLPGMDQDPKDVGLSEKLETFHNGPRFLQGAAVYNRPSFP